MTTCENWQLFVHDRRHNYAIGVYTHGQAQATKLTDEQLIQTEQFRKSHVLTHNVLRFFREQNVGCAVWHIDQNVLTKDEEVASLFVNGSWKKLLNEIDEKEYIRKLDVLKTKWQSRPDFLHYLFNTWLNLLAHKFVRVLTKSVMHFGVETTNRAESEHFSAEVVAFNMPW
ncbi:hypothetical protein M9H77_28554 [Catharanthus roseus]|uniref:Uncharacterized protein n=1 Tax=Catharanthus roseus TaxID=4058 RepID=A0ACC0AJT4_CATRO|nr:hypothetical protein M9H77_28554 [Catharanthus roseus]